MIYFIRHAESKYNDKIKQLKKEYGDQYKNAEKYIEYKFNPDFVDAGITPFGIHQCQELIQQLKFIDVEVVLVSPMRRALQTCQLLFKNHHSKPKIVAEPLFRQVLSSSCDIGSRIEESMAVFDGFDFSKITDKEAWYIHTINQKQTKVKLLQKLDGLSSAQRKNEAIKESMRLIKEMYDWKQKDTEKYDWYHEQMLPEYSQQKQIINTYLQKYSKIAIISHSKCIKRFLGHRIQNGKLVAIQKNQLK